MLFSLLQTLLNPMYAVTVPLVWLLLLVSAVVTLHVTGVTLRSIRASLQFTDRAVRVEADGTTANQTHM